MPVGPVDLADTIELDVCFAVAEKMAEQLGETVPARLRQLVAATIGEVFRERVRRSPNAAAYMQLEPASARWVTATWTEVERAVGRWQAALRAEGVARGHHAPQLPGVGPLRPGRAGTPPDHTPGLGMWKKLIYAGPPKIAKFQRGMVVDL
jgi:hypothetical protein